MNANSLDSFKNFAVIGSGTMGSGIATSLILAGFNVLLIDISQQFLDNALIKIKKNLDSRVKRQAITQEQSQEFLNNLKCQSGFKNLSNIDFVIEAASEKIDIKKNIFKELEQSLNDNAIIASNTSALSISKLASCTQRPDKVIGMHFFNPAHVMKLVEIIPGLKTSNETTQIVNSLVTKIDKTGVIIQECPGFLVNRLLFPYLNEALFAIEDNLASITKIDTLALEFGLPMGPFTLMDLTGLDICLDVNDFLYNEYGARFQTNKILKLMVDNGFLGQKTKKGFYLYGDSIDKNPSLNPEALELIASLKNQKEFCQGFDFNQIILPMFNEALYAYQENVVALKDIDTAMSLGTGLKRGILSLSNELTLSGCLDKIEALFKKHGERFRPSWLLKKMVAADIVSLSSLY